LSTKIKLKKENSSKEIEFDAALVLDIILRHWFLVKPSFQLLKFKDEDKDNSSIELDSDVKCKGLIPSPQGELIDLDNLFQMQ
jgi:hypothetical protein